MGYIDTINEDMGTLTILFDETRYAEYEFSGLEELEHAYAVTVHKSQGSEFPVVVMPVFPVAPILATRNLVYTAVTRGKQLVVLVGSEERLRVMVDNNQNRERYSALKGFLERYFDENL
jgi:exodeoxyribonuclease V alpha subunit